MPLRTGEVARVEIDAVSALEALRFRTVNPEAVRPAAGYTRIGKSWKF